MNRGAPVLVTATGRSRSDRLHERLYRGPHVGPELRDRRRDLGRLTDS
jgi:hypothetical protein